MTAVLGTMTAGKADNLLQRHSVYQTGIGSLCRGLAIAIEP